MYDEIAIVGIISAVTQMLKTAFLPSKFAGLCAVVLGLLISFGNNRAITVDTVLTGFYYGIAATGGYEGVKHLATPTRTLIGKMMK